MEDLFRKVLKAGLGVVANTTDKFKTTVNDLVETGSLSEDEGKRVINDLIDTTEAKKEAFEQKISELLKDVMDKMQLPNASVMKTLTERIRKLEEQYDIDDPETIMKG